MPDFDAFRQARADSRPPPEPLEPAVLAGRDFHFIPDPPPGLIADAIATIEAAPSDDANLLRVCLHVLDETVVPDERQALTDVLLDTRDPIDAHTLAALWVWLLGEWGKRNPGTDPASVPAGPPDPTLPDLSVQQRRREQANALLDLRRHIRSG